MFATTVSPHLVVGFVSLFGRDELSAVAVDFEPDPGACRRG
jgi:hypothetical protein